MTKIIFLDVDGVLNCMPYLNDISSDHGLIDESKLPLLKEIVESCDAKIVLLSTWNRLQYITDSQDAKLMWDELTNVLKKYGMDILSTTNPDTGNRPKAIIDWIEENIQDEIRFVSLDDDFSSLEYSKYGIGKNLIQTHYFCRKYEDGGLLPIHVKKAIAILNNN